MKQQFNWKNIIIILICLLAGGVLPFAFAPLQYFWIAPLSIAILLIVWLDTISAIRAAIYGLCFGLGMFGVGTSWVYISIHRFGNTSIPLAIIFTSLFVITLALFPALQGYCLIRFYRRDNILTKALIIFPSSWVLCEWLRSWIFTGFPWLLLGYSQVNSPLRGYAAVFGVYGVTLLTTLSAGLLVVIIKNFKKSWHSLIFCAISLLIIWFVGSLLVTIKWTQPQGNAIEVSIIQGNISQELKWLPEQLMPTLQRYRNLTLQHLHSDIIVWPEAAIPLSLKAAQPYINQLAKLAKKQHATLIFGIPVQHINGAKYYNAAIAVGEGNGMYYKRRLVPFGEYVPFERYLRGMFNFFNLPMSEFIAGSAKQKPLTAANSKIAPYICYEVAYTNLVRQNLPQVQLLMTISNDAWFGDSLAAAQHLQIAQMRCLETGRYMLFSTNNGITAIINPQGKIIKQLPKFQTAVLSGKVYAMRLLTPYIHIGSWPIVWLCLGLMVVFAFI
jgi:apolipoprotein N-acyltransferase